MLATLSVAGAWHAAIGAVPVESAEVRVARVGYRLAASGVARCPRREPLTGLLLHDLAAYDQDVRSTISQQYGLTTGIGVLHVVPGSPAEQAGLQAGDEIVALQAAPMATLRLPSPGKLASYDRIEAFTGLLTGGLASGSITTTIRQAAISREVTFPQRWGCAVRFAVLPGEKPAAWSDGRYAVVNKALAQAAGDDELAFALAHEMAHVVLGHAAARRPALAGLGIAGNKTREREREADRLGTLIAIDAGYTVKGAEALLERLARAHGGLSLTHPSASSRLAEIKRVAAETTPMAPKL